MSNTPPSGSPDNLRCANDAPISAGPLFWIGVALLVTNTPFGWLAIVACTSLAVVYTAKVFYTLGAVAYGVSWVMLGVGLLLVGSEGAGKVRRALLRIFKCSR